MSRLQITDLHWSPDRTHAPRWQLAGVELRVEPGEFVGLIGPNGSGKTSLLRCAYRAQRPDRGTVHLDGHDLWQQPPRWSAQRLAVMLQEFPDAFGLRVQEVVALGRAPHQGWWRPDSRADLDCIERVLHDLGLHEQAAQPFASLSGGEKQRVLLARALVQQPTLLMLDEPTNHLDPRYQLELLAHLRRRSLSILASFHDLNLAAAFCDRLYVLDRGRVVASGTPAQVLTAPRLSEVFGVQALIDRHPLAPHPRITWISPC